MGDCESKISTLKMVDIALLGPEQTSTYELFCTQYIPGRSYCNSCLAKTGFSEPYPEIVSLEGI